MKMIPLTRGKVAVVDDEDFDLLNQWPWYAQYSKKSELCYAACSSRKEGKLFRTAMHLVIMNPKPGEFVDHKDGNGLNNQKSNLRLCTHAQNLRNTKKSKRNTTGFKGVVRTPVGRFGAQISVDRTFHWLGTYDTPKEAALAYDNAARERFGEFARTNKDLNLI